MKEYRIYFNEEEEKVIDDLATKLDLPWSQVLRQAIRMYQLVDSGHSKLVKINPLTMQLKIYESPV